MTESRWQESAGSLLLLAAAQATGLIEQLQAALPAGAPGSRLVTSQAEPQQALLLTLLFLGAAGLARPWDLRTYSGDGLALLTGRRWAYGYVHTRRFLAELARAEADRPLSEAVARWSHQLWGQQSGYYIDLHRKPVYSDQHLPRGLIGRTGKILGSRAIGLLHDEQGHPLLARVDRGDSHLTQQTPSLVNSYQQALGCQPIKRIIVDREGLGADFLAEMEADFEMITLLRRNQYTDLASFSEVGEFVPLQWDQQGQVVAEVAPARFALTRTDGSSLPLYVALIRDQRRQTPLAVEPAELADLLPESDDWWLEEWPDPTPLPAPPTTPQLIPIVSTAPIDDVVACVQRYKRRWPAQENIIRDFLLPLGLDHNHGYHKQAVDNSEFSKRRQALQQQLDNVQRWRRLACQRTQRAGRLYDRRYDQAKARGDALYHDLNLEQIELEYFAIPRYLIKRHLDAKEQQIKAQMAPLWQAVWRAQTKSHQEDLKMQRYALKTRQLLRQLEELDAQARQMFELDNRQDQLMTSLRLALTNLVMWVRDHYFPPTYAHTTWKRLAAFFQLPGHRLDQPDRCLVYLRPFNDRQLNRDLDALCGRVNQARLRLPDGRVLQFLRYTSLALISDAPT